MKSDFAPSRHPLDAEVWASELAAKLRLVQASFSDGPAQTRATYLAEELQRALRSVGDGERPTHLAALAAQFPIADFADAPEPLPASPAPATEPTLLEQADALTSRLAGATPEERTAVANRLAAAGLLVRTRETPRVPDELRAKLGLKPEDPVDPERFQKLFATFADFVLTLDSIIWSVWRKLAPKSGIRRETADRVRTLLGSYLLGDREVASYQIVQALDRSRQLTVALLSAFGSAGEGFARWYLNAFAPEKIRAAVEAGNHGFLANSEARCWRRYAELAQGLNGPFIEEQVVASVVSYVEGVAAKPEPHPS